MANSFEVFPSRAVSVEILIRWVFAVVLKDGVGERTQNRLGMVPADHFQSAEDIADVDDLVADVAKVAAAEAGVDIEEVAGIVVAGHRGGGRIGGLDVPPFHCIPEL